MPGVPNARVLTDAFDENPGLIAWSPRGIHFSSSERTTSHLYVINPASKAITKHAGLGELTGGGFSITPDGVRVAFIGSGPSQFPDVYVGDTTVKRVSDTAAQIAAWPKHSREVIRWKSQDGAEIEGVLHKPSDFQAEPALPVARGHSRRADRHLAAGTVRQRQLLPD